MNITELLLKAQRLQLIEKKVVIVLQDFLFVCALEGTFGFSGLIKEVNA